jgi:RNA polymerase sigma factor (sigma-70 family)
MYDRRIAYFDSLPDRELVRLLLANDQEAVEYVFFHRCNGMFAHIIHSVFQSQGKKEELITEFYLYLCENEWNRLRKFEFKSSLNTWLTVIAVRFFRKKQAIQTKMIVVEPQLIVETQKDEADDYDVLNEMSRLELYKAIDKLSKPRERYALLADLTGKSAEEIAADMGCTVSAVYNLTKKARMELRTLLKDKEL